MNTDYIAPLHIAVVRHGSLIGNRDVAFIAEAVRLQLLDAAAAWGLAPPGCAVYDVGGVPGGERIAQIHLVPTDGDPEALGSHTKIGDSIVGDVDLEQSGSDVSTVVSHEALEILGNADLDRWVTAPEDAMEAGLLYATELCDPVEAEIYPIQVSIMGEERAVTVSDYVTPAWFGLPNPPGAEALGGEKYDQIGAVSYAFQIAPGGYAIAEDAAGNIRYLAAAGGAMFPARKLLPTSRTARIISKGRR